MVYFPVWMLNMAGASLLQPVFPLSKPGLVTRLTPPDVPRKTSSKYIVPAALLKAVSKLRYTLWRLPELNTGVVNFVQVEVALIRTEASRLVQVAFAQTCSSRDPLPFTQTLAVWFAFGVTVTVW